MSSDPALLASLGDGPIVSLEAVSRSRGRDPSELIAQRMMQGWAMLDETCPNASCFNEIPLLRNKNNEVSKCVGY
jgi:hypothetical protein